ANYTRPHSPCPRPTQSLWIRAHYFSPHFILSLSRLLSSGCVMGCGFRGGARVCVLSELERVGFWSLFQSAFLSCISRTEMVIILRCCHYYDYCCCCY
ncbi:hypothetical protein ANANG_G00186130, partial [Anguilla anguilla]